MKWGLLTFLLDHLGKVVLVVAAMLIISGVRASIHPKLVLITPDAASVQVTSTPNLVPPPLEFETSKPARVFGIVRCMLGVGLAIFVLWPRSRFRESVAKSFGPKGS